MKRPKAIEPGYPVFRGELSPLRTQVVFWCPFCLREHYHGAPDVLGIRGVSHKAAHCISGPLHAKGYYVFAANSSVSRSRRRRTA